MIRIFDELRDPWALALAQVTAAVSYAVGAPAWQSALTFVAVLAARVLAGLRFPLNRPPFMPRSVLTLREQLVAKLIAEGLTLDAIAQKRRVAREAVEKTYSSILEKLGYRYPWEVRWWAITVGLVRVPPRPPWIRRVIDSTLIRSIVTAGGLIGFGWTLYGIWNTFAR